jgi:hypothetical protein
VIPRRRYDGDRARGRRRFGPGLVGLVALATLALSGCKEAEVTALSSGYEPSHVEAVGDSDVQKVTFTDVGAEQVGLVTAAARQQGASTVVPYAALIYDGQGVTWVYTVADDLTFIRSQVVVDHIEGDQVLLSDGLGRGAEVVTVGAAEVYGAELGIGGGH